MNQHINCIQKACQRLSIPYEHIGSSGAFLRCWINDQTYTFIANEVPFNSHIVTRITSDKTFTGELLKEVIALPKSKSYIDPDCEPVFQPFREFQSVAEIEEDIMNHFSFPLVIKMNRGSQGKNVFKCTNSAEIQNALHHIYDQSSRLYDHVALVQAYVPIAREFRVIVFQQEIMLVYEKDFSEATFVGNLSPFHWDGAHARVITDQTLIKQIADHIQPMYSELDLQYGGLDVAVDTNGKMWLFEINTKPAYNYLIADVGEEVLVELYSRIFRALQ
ncbi:hypothetical protein LRY65_01520 [Candidatus Woesebacteria bacterium]|nr:hypothetical protein [Candidatus Woesebacteria bacterium]MCD8526872.1 hypothetical protein [Candidatus Woesebacteria bacterium]MCD8545790.1 hypothetical protein [Candidatus Woesebacteria bacterium]